MSIFDILRPPMGSGPKTFDWNDCPPIFPFTCDAKNVKKSMHNMLMVCLGGGMTYEDAKIAVDKEYGEALKRAEEMDEGAMKIYLKLYADWEKRRADKK